MRIDLSKLIADARYLVVDEDGTARLSPRLPRQDVMIAVDLRGAMKAFRRLAGDKQKFTANDLQVISGQSYSTVNRWENAGLIGVTGIDPDTRERLFDLPTAFACGVFGSLVRQRQTRPILRAVAECLGVSVADKSAELAAVVASN